MGRAATPKAGVRRTPSATTRKPKTLGVRQRAKAQSKDAQPRRIVTGDGHLVIRVPLTFALRGGRKRVITPNGETFPASPPSPELTPLIRALVRAHRWKRMLEDATFTSMQDLAAAEHVTPSYLARILRLTLLAPDIVERIMEGSASNTLRFDDLMKSFPVEWSSQVDLIEV